MEFWIGLLVSIPIAIATNLVTPKIQRWLDRNNKRKALEKTKNLLAEFNEVEIYRNNPHEFTQYLIYVGIKITFIGSLVGIIVALPYMISQILDVLIPSMLTERLIRNGLYLIAQLISIIGALMIINLCRQALSTWFKVKNFDKYKESVEGNLGIKISGKADARLKILGGGEA